MDKEQINEKMTELLEKNGEINKHRVFIKNN